MKAKTAGPLLGLAYLLTIVAANWAVATLGRVPVGFGLVAPAGVYFAGLAFTFRDLLHEAVGRRGVILAILGGATLSFLAASPTLAVASAAAFGLSELVDLAVYEPMRRKGWLIGVALSNVAGLVVDSMLFLTIAFGSWAFLPGQIVGKAWMTLLAVLLLALGRRTYGLLSRG